MNTKKHTKGFGFFFLLGLACISFEVSAQDFIDDPQGHFVEPFFEGLREYRNLITGVFALIMIVWGFQIFSKDTGSSGQGGQQSKTGGTIFNFVIALVVGLVIISVAWGLL